jgi:hypothetical protein
MQLAYKCVLLLFNNILEYPFSFLDAAEGVRQELVDLAFDEPFIWLSKMWIGTVSMFFLCGWIFRMSHNLIKPSVMPIFRYKYKNYLIFMIFKHITLFEIQNNSTIYNGKYIKKDSINLNKYVNCIYYSFLRWKNISLGKLETPKKKFLDNFFKKNSAKIIVFCLKIDFICALFSSIVNTKI